MTTDTAALVPPAMHLALPVVKVMGKPITYNSPGSGVALRIGTLPAGAHVIGGGLVVTTAFDDTGNDFIDIGTTADDDCFATDLNGATTGFQTLDEIASHNDYSASEIGITATYTGANANATAGAGYVFVMFIEPGQQA